MIHQVFEYRDNYVIRGQVWPLREVLKAFLERFQDAKQYARGDCRLDVTPEGELIIRREVIPGGIELSIRFSDVLEELDKPKYDR